MTKMILSKVDVLESTFEDICKWMHINKLKLNTNKTEFLILTSKSYKKPIPVIYVTLNGTIVNPSSNARNLGVHFDQHFTLNEHISKVTKSCYVSLRNINAIRPYLSQSAAETVIHAFITSKLDLCNGLFIGLPANKINRLQKIQNAHVIVFNVN